MTRVSLRNIDLNLLVILDALLTEKHVTRTGERLHLSQPAISHSLGKLRVLLDDPLLIRQGNDVLLSPLARSLQAPLREILSQIETLLGKSLDFDPATSQRIFHLAMSDYAAAIVLPRLLVRLRGEAPLMRLVVTQGSRHQMSEQIAQGQIDLALGVFPSLGGEIVKEVLFEETFSCLVDGSTLGEEQSLDLSTYLARPHLQVSMDGCFNGEVDHRLADEGLQRQIAVSVPHWGATPNLIRGTDLILTVASRTLDEIPLQPGLLRLTPPLNIAPFKFVQIWHSRFSDDLAHRWLREQVRLASAAQD